MTRLRLLTLHYHAADPMDKVTRFCTVVLVIAVTAMSGIGIYRWGIALFPSLGPRQQPQPSPPPSGPASANPSSNGPSGGVADPPAKPESEPSTVSFDSDDPEVNAAVEKARATVDRFVRAFNNPCALCHAFSVKKAYDTRSGSREHIWIEVTSIEGDTYHGTIANDPVDIPDLALGDEVSGSLAEISDWLYQVRDTMAGGFTVRVAVERAKAEGDTETYKGFKFLPEPQ